MGDIKMGLIKKPDRKLHSLLGHRVNLDAIAEKRYIDVFQNIEEAYKHWGYMNCGTYTALISIDPQFHSCTGLDSNQNNTKIKEVTKKEKKSFEEEKIQSEAILKKLRYRIREKAKRFKKLVYEEKKIGHLENPSDVVDVLYISTTLIGTELDHIQEINLTLTKGDFD